MKCRKIWHMDLLKFITKGIIMSWLLDDMVGQVCTRKYNNWNSMGLKEVPNGNLKLYCKISMHWLWLRIRYWWTIDFNNHEMHLLCSRLGTLVHLVSLTLPWLLNKMFSYQRLHINVIYSSFCWKLGSTVRQQMQ